MEALAVPSEKQTECGTAKAGRLFQHRVEYRREIAGRTVDDLQHLGGRGLLLQCLVRLGQQPRVLHCNNCLRGEAFEQRDLFVGEGPHLLAIHDERAKKSALLAQRDTEQAARAAQLDLRPR